MANELIVTISADTSTLDAAMSKASTSVVDASIAMAEAQKVAAAATKDYTDTLEALNAVASGTGPGQAAAAAEIAAVKTAADQATAAVFQMAEAKKQAVKAAREAAAAASGEAEAETGAAEAIGVAGAAADATAGANERLAASNIQVATSAGTMRGSMYAASGAAGILEGRIPIRAMERFLSGIPAVSAALQYAFPIIGAVALAEVLGEMVKKAYDLYEKFIDISGADDKLLADFQKMRDQDVFNVHSIETATARMDDATQSAEKLRTVAKGLHEIGLSGIFGDVATGNLAQLGTDVGFMLEAKRAADESGKQTENAIKLTLQQIKLQHELAVQTIDTAHAGDGGLPTAQRIVAEHEKDLALLKEQQKFEHQQEGALGNTAPKDSGNDIAMQKLLADNARENVSLTDLRRKYTEEIAKAEIEVEHAADAELSPAQRITAELEKQLSLHLEEENASRSGLPIQDQRLRQLKDEASAQKANADLATLVSETLGKTFDDEMKAETEQRREASEQQKAAAEEYKAEKESEIAIAKDAARVTIQAAEETFTYTQRQIQFEAELGIITAKTAQARLLAASELKQTETTGALQKESELFDPNLSRKEFEEYQQLQRQMTQVADKGALEREQITQKETLKIIQTYQKVATEFNTGMTRALNEWISGSQTAGQAFAKMFGDLELQLIDFVAEWLLKKAEMWALDHILQITGLAAQKTTQATANVGTVMGDAGLAFAGTMAFYSAINPPAAPALASAAYATTLAGGLSAQAFEMGGVVAGAAGSPVPIIAHAGERVLTASETSQFHSLVNSQTSTQSNSRVVNVGGITQNLAGARATPRAISTATQAALRRGFLGMGG